MSIPKHIFNQQADQCVKCGLCLPHCPTYRIFANENESPRGRIALMQGLLNEQIPASTHLREHLAHCLTCRACEQVCPSGVKYASLLDHTRQYLQQSAPAQPAKKALIDLGLKLARNKRWQKRLQDLLYLYRVSGLQALVRICGLTRLLRIRQIESILQGIQRYQSFNISRDNNGGTKGRIGLFTGCTGHLFDQQTVKDSMMLLQLLGYEVIIPEEQTCCGALHQHQGKMDDADYLALENIKAFKGVDTIIYIASGCGAQLKEYATLDLSETDMGKEGQLFSHKLTEISDFLARENLSAFRFRPLDRDVIIHTPCTMRNALRQTDASHHLLRHIPGLRLQSLSKDIGCCGAAGSYMLQHASLAEQIRQASIDHIRQSQAQIVTTSNIGCRLHLAAGLGNKLKMSHPVSILAQQLEELA